MYDIIVIGSGPSSCFMTYYLLKYTDYKICLITKCFVKFHCTYGIFEKHVKNSWFVEEDNFKDCFVDFKKEMKCDISCSNKKLDLTNTIEMKDEIYLLLDNQKCFLKLSQYFKEKNLNIIEKNVKKIEKTSQGKKVYFEDTFLESKMVIEGTGNYTPIGIKYLNEIPYNYQTFFGLKIKTKRPHNFKNVILMDWYDTQIEISKPPSFCYFIPYSSNILFCEETILIHPKVSQNELNQYHDILKERLEKRLNKYNIEIDKILFKEINSISMTRYIPDPDSLSFGIGVNGNIFSPISGYSVGLNIYNIPYIVDLIKNNNFNTRNIYLDYWNFFRKIIFLINYSGHNLILSLKTNKENSLFFKNFISKTNTNKEHFDVLFHNIFEKKLKFLLTIYIYFFLNKMITKRLLYNSFIIFSNNYNLLF